MQLLQITLFLFSFTKRQWKTSPKAGIDIGIYGIHEVW